MKPCDLADKELIETLKYVSFGISDYVALVRELVKRYEKLVVQLTE